jgi:hypothetical protein
MTTKKETINNIVRNDDKIFTSSNIWSVVVEHQLRTNVLNPGGSALWVGTDEDIGRFRAKMFCRTLFVHILK